ncbi:MAG: PIN domain-containing protein [Candidatus Woesearchaeota archaeon]
MAQNYYLDTSIWRDYYENRYDNLRPLGEWAFQFLKKVIEEQAVIIYSDFVEHELRKDYDSKKINSALNIILEAGLLKKIEITPRQFKEAAELSRERKVPYGDALHAIAARDNKAMIIARDHHFESLEDIAPSKKPEELI